MSLLSESSASQVHWSPGPSRGTAIYPLAVAANVGPELVELDESGTHVAHIGVEHPRLAARRCRGHRGQESCPYAAQCGREIARTLIPFPASGGELLRRFQDRCSASPAWGQVVRAWHGKKCSGSAGFGAFRGSTRTSWLRRWQIRQVMGSTPLAFKRRKPSQSLYGSEGRLTPRFGLAPTPASTEAGALTSLHQFMGAELPLWASFQSRVADHTRYAVSL